LTDDATRYALQLGPRLRTNFTRLTLHISLHTRPSFQQSPSQDAPSDRKRQLRSLPLASADGVDALPATMNMTLDVPPTWWRSFRKRLRDHILSPENSPLQYHALATQFPDTMLAGRSVVHIQPYKTAGARREVSNAQSMAQSLPPISQVLGEIHPPTYTRSTVSTPPTMTANPPITNTTAFNLSSAPQTFNLKGALKVVRYTQIS
jgi:hypothetical protein